MADDAPTQPLNAFQRLQQAKAEAKARAAPAAPTNGQQQPLSTPGQNPAYVRKAVEDELAELRAATHPGRNIALNKASYNLGQLVGGGELRENEIELELIDAMRAIGLPDSDIKSIRSGLTSGMKEPRTAPPPKTSNNFTPPTATLLPPDEGEEKERTSWWPEPIAERAAAFTETPAPNQLRRDDGQSLLYSGKVNGIIGESESGKSWIALLAVVQAVKRGERVLFLDFEDSPNSIYHRLQLLGMAPEVATLVHYADPTEALTALQHADLLEALAISYALIVVDGVNVAMTIQGYDLNSNTDATLFTNLLLQPMARTGACVLAVDHVTKDPNNRNKGAIGAQAKRALVTGCQLVAEVVELFGVGRSGAIRLFVDKDKNGKVRGISANGKYAGKALVESTTDSVRINITAPELQPREDTDVKSDWAPTQVMEKVSILLEGLTEPCSWSSIKRVVTGKEETIRKAIDVLHQRGHIAIESGPRNSLLCRSLKPYRMPQSDRLPTDSRPTPGVGEVSDSTDSPNPPHYVGGESGVTHGDSLPLDKVTDSPASVDLPDGYQHCNSCGQPASDAEVELGDGYCMNCRGDG